MYFVDFILIMYFVHSSRTVKLKYDFQANLTGENSAVLPDITRYPVIA